jgi:hypothetical protein
MNCIICSSGNPCRSPTGGGFYECRCGAPTSLIEGNVKNWYPAKDIPLFVAYWDKYKRTVSHGLRLPKERTKEQLANIDALNKFEKEYNK